MPQSARQEGIAMPTLSSATLKQITPEVARPSYDYTKIGVGIMHISLGAFHRAHQAVYTDDVLAKDGGNWGICGIGAMASDKALIDKMKGQDFLYTVMTRGAKSEARIIGAMRDAMVMPENPEAVIARLADPSIKILSFTITEKGYCHDPQTGLLNPQHPMIAHDLAQPNMPQSAIGLAVAGLKARFEKGLPPFTVMSCDNLPGNGNKAKSIILAYAKLLDAKLAAWIEANVAFPNTMVDRITPVTAQADKDHLAQQFGYHDDGLVTCEPFRQWILEDNFPQGRPAWEKAGAQFVKDVHPYELAKIRLLNVSHTVFAYPAFLMNYVWVSDGASDKLLAKYVRNVMDNEITSTLPPVPGMELESYKTTIIERFANPNIRDTWERICSDGSQKIANQLLPIVRERFAKNQDAKGLILLVAAWFRYLNCKFDNGSAFKLNDPMAERLHKLAVEGGKDPSGLLAVREIFGDDLPKDPRFINQIKADLAAIYDKGVAQVIGERYK